MMQILCVAFVMYIAVILGKGLRKPQGYEEEHEEKCSDSYKEISDKIMELNRYKDGIDVTSDMIADIMSCSPGRVAKTVRISVLENNHDYDILLTGEDEASELLLELLNSERENLSTSLRSRIKKIS